MGCCGRKSFTNRNKNIVNNNSNSSNNTIKCKTCSKTLYFRSGDKLVYCSTCKKFIELR